MSTLYNFFENQYNAFLPSNYSYLMVESIKKQILFLKLQKNRMRIQNLKMLFLISLTIIVVRLIQVIDKLDFNFEVNHFSFNLTTLISVMLVVLYFIFEENRNWINKKLLN
jgi:hypothetical protein